MLGYEVIQSAGYTGSQLLARLVTGISAIVIARALGASTTGSYQFANSFLAFVAMLFEFGLFVPASRLAARSNEKAERSGVFGAALVAFIPVGAGYLVAVVALSFGIDTWFHVRAGTTVRLLSPIFLIYPFQFVIIQMSQGMRRLHVFSVTQMIAALLALGLILGYISSGQRLTLATALLLASSGQTVALLIAALWLRPIFAHARRRVGEIVAEARSWGFKNYVGRVVSVGTYNMDVLMVAAFTNQRQVAFYTLAGGIASVVMFPASGLAAALFPRMVSGGRLLRSWKLAVWVFAVAGVALVWSLSAIFVRIALGQQYRQVVPLVLPLALAAGIRGVTQIYNTYLSANARGRELRSAGFILAGSNLLMNFALIPSFGATGAAWASFLALLANYIAHVVYYQRGLREDPVSGNSEG